MIARLLEEKLAYHPYYKHIGKLPEGTILHVKNKNRFSDKFVAATKTGYILNVGVDEVVEEY